jgi:hypothetical protein
MHKTILDIDYSPSSNKLTQTVGGIHTHVLSNLPEDSDVFSCADAEALNSGVHRNHGQENLGDPDGRNNFAREVSFERV